MDELTVLLDLSSDRDGPGVCADHVKVCWEIGTVEWSDSEQQRMDAQWAHFVAEAEAQGRHLFNGPVSRLIRAERHADGAVELRLGPCDYKSFIVTRVRDRAWFEHHAPAAMAMALGNSALLTHGNAALLGIRSKRVGMYPGRAHLIGGVLDELGTGRFEPVTQGLIDHLLLELHEEARVRSDDLESQRIPACWPRLLGIAQDEFLGQPEAFWQWETRTPLEQIAQRFTPDEHDGGVLVGKAEVPAELWKTMTPVARQAWRIWSGRKENAF